MENQISSKEKEETSGDMESSEELSTEEEESEEHIEKRLNKDEQAHKSSKQKRNRGGGYGPKTGGGRLPQIGAGKLYSEEDTSPARQTFYQSHIFPMPLLETLKVTECNQFDLSAHCHCHCTDISNIVIFSGASHSRFLSVFPSLCRSVRPSVTIKIPIPSPT